VPLIFFNLLTLFVKVELFFNLKKNGCPKVVIFMSVKNVYLFDYQMKVKKELCDRNVMSFF